MERNPTIKVGIENILSMLDLLRLGVSSKKQASVKEAVHHFYSFWGQKINMAKSQLVFSSNMQLGWQTSFRPDVEFRSLRNLLCTWACTFYIGGLVKVRVILESAKKVECLEEEEYVYGH